MPVESGNRFLGRTGTTSGPSRGKPPGIPGSYQHTFGSEYRQHIDNFAQSEEIGCDTHNVQTSAKEIEKN